MVALGLVLLVLSGALALGVVLSNTDPVSASAFGVTLSDVTIGGFFLVGAVTGLAFMLGLVMMAAGASRKRGKRVRTRREVKDVRSEREQLAAENEELRARLDRERPAPISTSADGSGVYPSERANSDATTNEDVDTRDTRGGLFHRS
jgi:hypothetical protein